MTDNEKMGEKAIYPENDGSHDHEHEENMEKDNINEEEAGENDDDEFDGMTPEEYNALNHKMDEVNSALDNIEQKNEVIYSELLKLLQSNREIREQMESMSTTTNASKSAEK